MTLDAASVGRVGYRRGRRKVQLGSDDQVALKSFINQRESPINTFSYHYVEASRHPIDLLIAICVHHGIRRLDSGRRTRTQSLGGNPFDASVVYFRESLS